MALTFGTGFADASNLLGPYEKWMFDIGKVFDLPSLMLDQAASLSCVAEFATPLPEGSLDPVTEVVQPDGKTYKVSLPVLYQGGGFASKFLPFVLTPEQPGSLLDQSSDAVQNFLVSFGTDGRPENGRFRVNFPIRPETLSATPSAAPAATPDPALNGAAPKVILAIIDLGIPFAHAAYRQVTGGTRIDFAWAQSAPTDNSLLFGREFTRTGIDAMVAAHKGDEEAIYAAAGLLSQPNAPALPLSRAHSHGAHVLDSLAGNWPADTAAQTRIIAVDLPSSSVWETSGFGKDMFVLSALHYIFDRADRIRDAYGCADLPLVINLSYGYSGGTHDGGDMIEAAMAEMVAHRNAIAPTTLVMPSGNMLQDRLFAHLTDGKFTPDPDDPSIKRADLHWFAPANDRTSSFLEMWLPPGVQPEDIGLSLTAPNGPTGLEAEALPFRGQSFYGATIRVADRAVGQLTFDHYRGQRWRIMMLLAPSEVNAPAAQLVCGNETYQATPSGIWTLTLRARQSVSFPEVKQDSDGLAVPGGIACRIQRDTSYGQGNTGARQSFFLDQAFNPSQPDGDPGVTDSLSPGAALRHFGSLNGMATGAGTIIVGGSVRSSGKAARYASAGVRSPGGDALGPQVDASAPTDRSIIAQGVVAAGTRSGTTVALQGTSSAAPQVARQIAMAHLAGTIPPAPNRAQVLLALSGRPGVQPVLPTNDDPLSQARLGKLLLT